MVGQLPGRDPLPPVLGGASQPGLGLVEALRRGDVGPGQGDEMLVTVRHAGTRDRAASVDAAAKVTGQPQTDPGFPMGRLEGAVTGVGVSQTASSRP